MIKEKKFYYLVFALILIVNFLLNIQGIGWGLPDRWNIDQKVTEALKMASARTIVSSDFYHPPFYLYMLIIFLAPYIGILKITHYPLAKVAMLANDSWIKVAAAFPDFATNLFIAARLFSAILGVLTVVCVYLTAKRIYNNKIAILASGILACTMGFVGTNHLEISSALINFLGALVVYFCVRELDARKGRDLLIASFLSGIAVATKLNGAFLLPLPFITYFLLKRRLPLNRFTMVLIIIPAVGFLAGWPSFFSTLNGMMVGVSFYKDFLFAPLPDLSIPVNLINYIIQLVVIFGVPFSIFIIYGLFISIKKLFSQYQSNDKFIVLASLVLPYLLMNGISVHHVHAYTKFIILIAPPLAIVGGIGMYEALKYLKLPLRIGIGALIFIYSIAYTANGNAQFVNKDTRYFSTKWIEKNIPGGSTVEHIDHVDWLFSSRLLKNYHIIFMGRDLSVYTGKGFYKLNQSGNLRDVQKIVEDYCRSINERGSYSEYFVMFLPEVTDMYGYANPVLEHDKLVNNFLKNKFGYHAEAAFLPSNWKVLSSRVRGLSYPKNLFWNPIPDSAYVSPVILIYKRSS